MQPQNKTSTERSQVMPTYDAETQDLIDRAMSLSDPKYLARQLAERLRKLVGEACGIGEEHIAARIEQLGEALGLELTHEHEQRLAAIRHAAGVEGKGQP